MGGWGVLFFVWLCVFFVWVSGFSFFFALLLRIVPLRCFTPLQRPSEKHCLSSALPVRSAASASAGCCLALRHRLVTLATCIAVLVALVTESTALRPEAAAAAARAFIQGGYCARICSSVMLRLGFW